MASVIANVQIFFDACEDGNTKYISEALAADSSLLNKCDENGLFPLMIAVKEEELETVKLLLKLGADVNRTAASGPFEGATALWLAADQKRWSFIEPLLGAKANPNMTP